MNQKKARKVALREARKSLAAFDISKNGTYYYPGGGLTKRRIKRHPDLAEVHRLGALRNDPKPFYPQHSARISERIRAEVLADWEKAQHLMLNGGDITWDEYEAARWAVICNNRR